MPIRVLDVETINQIAAGEVVERPASVVKELVENALDAGATRIAVEIKGGGVGLIRVTDNGGGIPGIEVATAFERHATSKITGPGDLFSIGSLGFRGEALPSVAAVADVEMVTRAEGEPAGTVMCLEGGNIIKKQWQARARGTTVTVRDLFRRMPARLKFLKSLPTETGHVANIVSQYALAFPEAGFSLTVDGRETLRTSGSGKLLDAVIGIYGVELAGRMLPVSGQEEGWQAGRGDFRIGVTGMIGAPEVGRAGRGNMSFFVNRRWVTNRILGFAVEEAYSGLMMTGRHPVAILNISLPTEEVDVNIHPAKSEVKFRHEGEVFRAVQKAVRQALTAQMPVPLIEEPAATYNAPAGYVRREWPITTSTELPEPVHESAPRLMTSLPALRVVGQVMNRYIVAEGPDGLYLIDQHAAHERIRYEEVKRRRERRQPDVQGLLEPATIEVTPRQEPVLKSCLGILAEYGFTLEPFGERTYLARAVPAIAAGDNWKAMLGELLDELGGEARSRWEEKILYSVACHGAIRSGQALKDDEMREIVRQLEKCAEPQTCPHGRPTVMRLSSGQLEREFGREG